jgi:hypothetical protein
MVIRIADHVRTHSTYADGEVIYQLLVKEFEAGRNVTLSFASIKSIPSAFVNAALVKLLERFDFKFIQSRLSIIDSTRQINRLIKDRFHFATSERAA